MPNTILPMSYIPRLSPFLEMIYLQIWAYGYNINDNGIGIWEAKDNECVEMNSYLQQALWACASLGLVPHITKANN